MAVALLCFGTSAVAAFTQGVESGLTREDVTALVDQIPTDPAAGNSVNILFIGSDDRSGENGVIGGVDDTLENVMRSDTAFVMHISSNRKRIEMVSIPRDSLVDIPVCRTPRGETRPAQDAMFNTAFAKGWDKGGTIASAAACTITAVQSITHLPIHHFVVVDFIGFQKMVNAVGGVDICLDRPMKDSRYTGMDLPAGPQRLNGVQALQFARARHVTGTDGSDTSRIDRQQQLLGALVQEVLSKNVVTDSPKLAKFVGAVTKSLTMDTGMSLDTMVGLAYSLRNINTSEVVFMTVPFVNDGNRVRWTSDADTVWKAMAKDQSIIEALNPPPPPPKPGEKPTPTPTPTQVVTVDQMQADTQVCAAQ